MTPPWNVNGLVNAGVTASMNDAGRLAGCGDLVWTLDAAWSSLILSGSAAGMYPDADVPAILAGWQHLLSMDEVDATVAGTRQFEAQFPGLTVSVWGVVDGFTYHANTLDVFETGLGVGDAGDEGDGLVEQAGDGFAATGVDGALMTMSIGQHLIDQVAEGVTGDLAGHGVGDDAR